MPAGRSVPKPQEDRAGALAPAFLRVFTSPEGSYGLSEGVMPDDNQVRLDRSVNKASDVSMR